MVGTLTHPLSQKFRQVLEFNLIWLSHNSSEILLRYLTQQLERSADIISISLTRIQRTARLHIRHCFLQRTEIGKSKNSGR